MKKIIVVVDLGHFKAYRVSKNPMESVRTELIEGYDIIESRGKLSDKLSDSAGRFGTGGGKNGSAKGYGEPHHLQTEIEKKLIKMIAHDINRLINKENYPRWYLAAVKKINRQIVDRLGSTVRSKLYKNITSDLTKTHRSEILSYFE
jgi:hypothetical protein